MSTNHQKESDAARTVRQLVATILSLPNRAVHEALESLPDRGHALITRLTAARASHHDLIRPDLDALLAQAVPTCLVSANEAVERIGDMCSAEQPERLRVLKQDDGDVIVAIITTSKVADVEFCAPGSGGGKSPRTIAALRALAEAIHADNEADPTRRGEGDWKAP